MIKQNIFLLLLCLQTIIFCPLFSQTETTDSLPFLLNNQYIETEIEFLSERQEDVISDYSELVEDLIYYSENKMNINRPDYDALLSVFRLTDYQVYQLKKYLDTQGELKSMYELRIIDGFDEKTISFLMPYIEILSVEKKEKIKFKNIFKYGKQNILARYKQTLEEKKGYSPIADSLLALNPNARYKGKPQSYLFKYNFNYKNKVRFGFTAEQDAGEEFFKNSNSYGFDFYSAFFSLKDLKILKTLVIGDYQVRLGQGLSMWTGFQLNKSLSSTDISRHSEHIKQYSSANEDYFFRGIGTTLNFKNVDITLFYSFRKKDAAIDSLGENEYVITSLYQTGLHRTEREIENEKNVNQQIAGGYVSYTGRIFKIGGSVSYSQYNKALNRTLLPYNQFTFNEKSNLNGSIDYTVLVKKISFFGESAISKNKGFGTLNGILLYIDDSFTMSVLHRYYSVNYQAINAGAFGESSSNNNETGLFVGFNASLGKYFLLDANIDYFRFMWLKYQVDAPSDGFEVASQLTFSLQNKLNVYFRFKYKSKEQNLLAGSYNQVLHYHKQTYRLHFTYSPLLSVTLKNRIEFINYKPYQKADFEQGYLIYQDIVWRYKWISLTGRFAIFDTYSYQTRIYAYEDDVIYGYGSGAYYDKGSRVYLLIQLKFIERINLGLRIAQTFYRSKHSIGSGLEEIAKNHKTDITCQVFVKL